jgi:hypothetical protein
MVATILSLALVQPAGFPAEWQVPTQQVLSENTKLEGSYAKYSDWVFSVSGADRVIHYAAVEKAVALLCPSGSVPDYRMRDHFAVPVYETAKGYKASVGFENLPKTQRVFLDNPLISSLGLDVMVSEDVAYRDEFLEFYVSGRTKYPPVESSEYGQTVLVSRSPIMGMLRYAIVTDRLVSAATASEYAVSDWHVKWLAWSVMFRQKVSPKWEAGASMTTVRLSNGPSLRALPFVGDSYVSGKELNAKGFPCVVENYEGQPWLKVTSGNRWIALRSLGNKSRTNSGEQTLSTSAFSYDKDLWVPLDPLLDVFGLTITSQE